MAINNNQLARIVAPSINDTDYANKMATAFTNINDNFKKIASLPFLQGLQGDSYELKEYHVFEKLSSSPDELKLGNAVLTEEGAVLINAIFNTSFKSGNLLSELRKNTEFILNNVSAFDSFIEGDKNNINNSKIINNSIYFYVITDDSGEVIQKSKHLGQYFYFIDGRVKELGNAYYNDNKTDLDNFNDYTGFFQYNPENQSYFKVEIVPTLYYDKDKNDICWKFNNSKTGISAIGASGANGKDTTFYYVLTYVDAVDNISGEVKEVFVENKWVKLSDLDENSDFNLQNSIALICIKSNDDSIDEDNKDTMHAFGEIRKVDDNSGWWAYWDNSLVIDSLVTNTSINQYFYKMGYNSDGNFPRYLAIPIDTNRDENNRKGHVLMSDEGDLVLRGVEKAWDNYNNQNLQSLQNTKDDLSLKIENYNIDVNNHAITNVSEISGTTCDFTNGKIGSIDAISITTTKNIKSTSGDIDTLKCIGIDTKTLDATESITSKVNNVPGVEVGMPIGSIIMWPSMNPPEGWIECNGYCIPLQNDGKTVYSGYSEFQKLANVLLTTEKYYIKTPTKSFVSVNGDIIGKGSMVVLPDFQFRFPLGVGIMGNYKSDGSIDSDNPGAIGISGGSARVKLTAKQSGVPAHTHNIQVINDADNGIVDDVVYGGGGQLGGGQKGHIYKAAYWKSGQHAIAADNTPQPAAEYHNNIPPYQTINFIIKYK